MAGAPVKVRVGVDVGAQPAGSEPRVQRPTSREEPRVERVVVERGPSRDDEDDVEQTGERPAVKPRPTIKEIISQAAGLAEVGAGAADGLGAEAAADTLRRGADVARKGVAAVEGVKREVEPVVEATKGLWKSMEERGWVGVRPPINIAEMQGRGRRPSSKKEGE